MTTINTAYKLTTGIVFIVLTLFLLFTARIAHAQNTSGVIGPVVNAGHRAVQYRATFNPDSNAFSNRVHYEQAINDDVQWRIVAQTNKTNDHTFDFSHLQGELLIQLSENDQDYQTGLRIDARLRGNDGAKFIGVNWANQYAVTENLKLRATALTHVEFGDDRRSGINLKTRADVNYKFDPTFSGGFEVFNAYGYTSDIPSLSEQNHQFGPFLNTKFGDGYSLYTGALFGLTDAAPDQELRFRVGRAF